jgi:hypothetical protein
MKTFKVSDRVVSIKDCRNGSFKKGEIMKVERIYHGALGLTGDTIATFDEIELIESDTVEVPRELAGQTAKMYENALRMFARANAYAGDKPFPTFEEFDTWYSETEPVKSKCECKWTQQVYDYLVEFGVREVFPEVGKEYEFSEDGENWIKDIFESYESNNSIGFTHIRPIQPSRLEQLKAKHPNLTDTEQKELLDLLLTQLVESTS